MQIDHDAEAFPFEQLAASLRQRIADGTYPAGSRIPTLMALESESWAVADDGPARRETTRIRGLGPVQARTQDVRRARGRPPALSAGSGAGRRDGGSVEHMGTSLNEREIAARTVQIRTGISLDEARVVAANLGTGHLIRVRVISDKMLDELVDRADPNSLGSIIQATRR